MPSQTGSSHDYFMFPAAKKNVDKKKGRDISRPLKLSIMLHFVCHFTKSDCRINPDRVFGHCYYPMGPFQCNAHTTTLSARLIATRSTSHHQQGCPQQLLVYPQVRDQTRFVGRFLQGVFYYSGHIVLVSTLTEYFRKTFQSAWCTSAGHRFTMFPEAMILGKGLV